MREVLILETEGLEMERLEREGTEKERVGVERKGVEIEGVERDGVNCRCDLDLIISLYFFMFLCTGNVPWSVGTSCAKAVQLHHAEPAATADIQSLRTSVFKGKIITKTLHLLLGNF